jgi:hypothetical protein
MRYIYGEKKIQSIFERNGFKVIYPNDYSVEEQVALMKNCKEFVSASGAATMWSNFMSNNSKVIVLCRNYTREEIHFQYAFDYLKQHQAIYIDASISPVPTSIISSYGSNCIIGVNYWLKKYFDDNKFKLDDKDLEQDLDAMLGYLYDTGLHYSHERCDTAYTNKKKYPKWLAKIIMLFMKKKDRQIFRKKHVK